jgi:hypothetical protein
MACSKRLDSEEILLKHPVTFQLIEIAPEAVFPDWARLIFISIL